MDCPKCGAAQEAGREECSACGIVFARWQPRQVRRTTASTTPVPAPEPQQKIPALFIVIGLVLAVGLGLIWTKHRQANKKQVSADDMINEINNKGANLRRQLREEQAAIARAQARASMTANAVAQKLPSDIDEDKIKQMIEQCDYFRDAAVVDLPKKFNVNTYGMTIEQYPALPLAAMQNLIEFDPPFSVMGAGRYRDPANPGQEINVKVGMYAYSKVDVREDGDLYHFGLGRRKVLITKAAPYSESSIGAAFKWDFEQSAGSALAPEGDNRNGGLQMQRTASGWSIQSIWRNSRSGSTSLNCR